MQNLVPRLPLNDNLSDKSWVEASVVPRRFFTIRRKNTSGDPPIPFWFWCTGNVGAAIEQDEASLTHIARRKALS